MLSSFYIYIYIYIYNIYYFFLYVVCIFIRFKIPMSISPFLAVTTRYILLRRVGTKYLQRSSMSRRFTACHVRGRQPNCFTLIFRSNGRYTHRSAAAHTRRLRKRIVVSRRLFMHGPPFPPFPLDV